MKTRPRLLSPSTSATPATSFLCTRQVEFNLWLDSTPRRVITAACPWRSSRATPSSQLSALSSAVENTPEESPIGTACEPLFFRNASSDNRQTVRDKNRAMHLCIPRYHLAQLIARTMNKCHGTPTSRKCLKGERTRPREDPKLEECLIYISRYLG